MKYDPTFIAKLQQGIDGVIRQRRPSVKKDNFGSEMCVYRASNGDKCFIGQGIPDENYNEKLEGQPVWQSPVQIAWIGRVLTEEEVVIAMTFQNCHDEFYDNLDEFRANVREAIKQYNLQSYLKLPE